MKKITIEPIKGVSEFNGNLSILERSFVNLKGEEKTAYFRASGEFLSIYRQNIEHINDLLERAINELIPEFEIENMYFFDIDRQTLFTQLKEKPDWAIKYINTKKLSKFL
jgi:hypothetical protein